MEAVLHSRPWITEDDIAAVGVAMTSEWLGQGVRCEELELRCARWLGADYGVAIGSGSAAVQMALHGLRIGAGDEVILPTYVCVSVLEAVVTVGATPVLCDVGDRWLVEPENIRPHLGSRTRAVIVPHLYGLFADVAAISSLGVAVIEDCAQALDAEGARTMAGDVAVLSFHPTKCLTAGEGGMAVTRDPAVANRMRTLRDGAAAGLRLFSPLSDIAAALVLSQATRYSAMLARRSEIAQAYRAAIEIVMPVSMARLRGADTMHFRFPVSLAGGLDKTQAAFLDRGVHVRRGVDQLLHRILGMADERFPTAVELFDTTVSLPIYPALTEGDLARCIAATREILRA